MDTTRTKPSLFIASSVEGLGIADAINANLEHEAHCTIWRAGTFKLSSQSVDDLVRKSSMVDFAVFAFTPDDVSRIRSHEELVARDNVVFELGLFIGAIGKDRCYIVKPRGVDMHLPSDLLGMNVADYAPDRPDADTASALNYACKQVKDRIAELGAIARSPSVRANGPARHVANPPDQKPQDALQVGRFVAGFNGPEKPRDKASRAVRDYSLANAAGPLDIAALSAAAAGLLPTSRQNSQANTPALRVAIAVGPIQKLLRPAELEAPDLADAIHQQALFAEPRLFSKSKGVDQKIEDSTLVLEQERGVRIQLGEDGSLLLRLPLDRAEGGRRNGFGMFGVIQEDVMRELAAALSFGAWLLDKIDPTQRAAHVALAASIEASDHMGWRTQAEQDASPNSGTMRMSNGRKAPTSATDKPRAAMRFQAAELAEDLMVPLRRQMKS